MPWPLQSPGCTHLFASVPIRSPHSHSSSCRPPGGWASWEQRGRGSQSRQVHGDLQLRKCPHGTLGDALEHACTSSLHLLTDPLPSLPSEQQEVPACLHFPPSSGDRKLCLFPPWNLLARAPPSASLPLLLPVNPSLSLSARVYFLHSS